MRVEVVSPPNARNVLLNLLQERSPETRADDVARIAAIYLDDVESIIVRYKGELPRALRVRGSDGRVYWWQYLKNLYVVYTVEDEGLGFMRTKRTVTILTFEPRLPGH